MRSFRLAALVLVLAAAGTACDGRVESEGRAPDVPVQGGEALQVEVNPVGDTLAIDTPLVGTPGATRPERDSL